MAKQSKTRKVAWEILRDKSVQRHHVFQLLQGMVKRGTRLHTDGAFIYKQIERWWPARSSSRVSSWAIWNRDDQIGFFFLLNVYFTDLTQGVANFNPCSIIPFGLEYRAATGALDHNRS
jgi:hypothetical protein